MIYFIRDISIVESSQICESLRPDLTNIDQAVAIILFVQGLSERALEVLKLRSILSSGS